MTRYRYGADPIKHRARTLQGPASAGGAAFCQSAGERCPWAEDSGRCRALPGSQHSSTALCFIWEGGRSWSSRYGTDSAGSPWVCLLPDGNLSRSRTQLWGLGNKTTQSPAHGAEVASDCSAGDAAEERTWRGLRIKHHEHNPSGLGLSHDVWCRSLPAPPQQAPHSALGTAPGTAPRSQQSRLEGSAPGIPSPAQTRCHCASDSAE